MVLFDRRGDPDGLVDAIEEESLAKLGTPVGRTSEYLRGGYGRVDNKSVRCNAHKRSILFMEPLHFKVELALDLVRVGEGEIACGV